ncbi:hypothetical protein VTN02DRAFT_2943 [Thermoascus thermophilus]
MAAAPWPGVRPSSLHHSPPAPPGPALPLRPLPPPLLPPPPRLASSFLFPLPSTSSSPQPPRLRSPPRSHRYPVDRDHGPVLSALYSFWGAPPGTVRDASTDRSAVIGSAVIRFPQSMVG